MISSREAKFNHFPSPPISLSHLFPPFVLLFFCPSSSPLNSYLSVSLVQSKSEWRSFWTFSLKWWREMKIILTVLTRSSAIAGRPRDAKAGQPRWSILVPIESAYSISYQWSKVTFVVSCTVSEIRRLIGRKSPIRTYPTLINALAWGDPLRISG